MTQEDYAEFMDALCGDNYDGEKAERILRERTWKHLEKDIRHRLDKAA